MEVGKSKPANVRLGWLEWLGFTSRPDFSKARLLGGAIGSFSVVLLIVFSLIGFVILCRLMFAAIGHPIVPGDETSEAIRNFGLLLTAGSVSL